MERDVSRDGWDNRLRYRILTRGKSVWDRLNRTPALHGLVNRVLINSAINLSRTRPHPFSTLTPYTSLDSLRDRSYFTRHLPVSDRVVTAPEDLVAALFERPKDNARLSSKSTLLFASFANWFTDGFLLTDLRQDDGEPGAETSRTHSSHDLDLSQLYGL